jgi:flagellar biosynthesis/type III secretory pathway protein FliH
MSNDNKEADAKFRGFVEGVTAFADSAEQARAYIDGYRDGMKDGFREGWVAARKEGTESDTAGQSA